MDRSRRGADGSTGVVLRLTLQAAIGVLVVLYAFGMALRPAYAQQQHIPRGQAIPENIRWVNATATGANTSASATWTSAVGNTSHHKIPVHVSAATLGRLGNAAIRRGLPLVGWGLVFRDLVNAAGWAIDDLQQQVMNPGREQPTLNPQGYCHYASNVWTCFNAIVDAVDYIDDTRAQALRNSGAGIGPVWYEQVNPTTWSVYLDHPNSTQHNNWVLSYRSTTNATNGYPPAIAPAPISDTDVGNMIKATPQVVDAVLIDPQTGAPIRTQELTDALNALRQQLEAANGQAPGTDLVPAEDYADTTPSQTEWPEFCSWAKRVCDWMFDLEPEPAHPDVPYVELDPVELEEYDSGLGQGTCPAPYSTAVLDGEFEIQWDGLCGFVEYLRPLLIGLAWVVAAFIVVNSAKRA